MTKFAAGRGLFLAGVMTLAFSTASFAVTGGQIVQEWTARRREPLTALSIRQTHSAGEKKEVEAAHSLYLQLRDKELTVAEGAMLVLFLGGFRHELAIEKKFAKSQDPVLAVASMIVPSLPNALVKASRAPLDKKMGNLLVDWAMNLEEAEWVRRFDLSHCDVTFHRARAAGNEPQFSTVVRVKHTGYLFLRHAGGGTAPQSDISRNTQVTVNAGFFDPGSGGVLGSLVVGGKAFGPPLPGRGAMGWDEQGRIVFGRGEYTKSGNGDVTWTDPRFSGLRDAVQGGPLLLDNGDLRFNWENFTEDFLLGRHPRTVVFSDSQSLYFLVVDGRNRMHGSGMSVAEIQGYLEENYPMARDALNLDGGGSSAVFLLGQPANVQSDPGRRIPYAFAVL